MLNEKKNLLNRNTLFSIRSHQRQLGVKEKMKRRALLVSVFLCLFLIGLVYFLSPVSDIFRITVTGNNYLDEEDIIARSGLDTRKKYLLSFPSVIEKKLLEDPLIASAKVSLKNDRVINIEVSEKKLIGYLFADEGLVLLTDSDERIPVVRENMYLITKVPIIEGFSDEELILLEKNLVTCDHAIINEISEIHKFPQLKYQDVELVMRDGNYIFTSVYGLDLLNRYYDIESSYARTGNSCYYFEDISGNAYTSACPWEPEKEKKEEDREEDYEEDYYDEDYEEDEG